MKNTVSIARGKWQAEICPEWGGNLVCLSCGDRELLRTPKDLEEIKNSPVLYGIPLLLPANRTENARFSFAGKEYALPLNEPLRNNSIHGALHSAAFQVERITENSVVTSLENTGEWYPFPFRITIEDTLSETGLTRDLTLENTGEVTMPYTLAYHIAFVEPSFFAAPVGKRYLVNENFIPTGELAELSEREQAYRGGMAPDGNRVSGFYTACGDTVVIGDYKMKLSRQFDHFVLFNGSGNEGFLCIEPQCGAVNGLNSGICRRLKPGEQEVLTVTISK